jgi:hypothetical protein
MYANETLLVISVSSASISGSTTSLASLNSLSFFEMINGYTAKTNADFRREKRTQDSESNQTLAGGRMPCRAAV